MGTFPFSVFFKKHTISRRDSFEEKKILALLTINYWSTSMQCEWQKYNACRKQAVGICKAHLAIILFPSALLSLA